MYRHSISLHLRKTNNWQNFKPLRFTEQFLAAVVMICQERQPETVSVWHSPLSGTTETYQFTSLPSIFVQNMNRRPVRESDDQAIRETGWFRRGRRTRNWLSRSDSVETTQLLSVLPQGSHIINIMRISSSQHTVKFWIAWKNGNSNDGMTEQKITVVASLRLRNLNCFYFHLHNLREDLVFAFPYNSK